MRLDDTDHSDYQRWLRYAEPFHAKAGEHILHMPRVLATRLGIPGYDFLIFDDQRLVLPLYDKMGWPTDRILIGHADAPDLVWQHIAWRYLAVRNVTAVVPATA